MPSISSFQDYLDDLFGRKLERGDARDVAARTLPEDFTGQVFERARELAAEIDGQTARLDILIAETRQALAEADRQVAATRPRIVGPARRRGDLLGEFRIEPGQPTGAAVTTSATIEARAKLVAPLRRRLASLERQRWLLSQERGQLKKIADRAAAGDVSLIQHLSDYWRGRLEIGGAMLGKLPPAARELVNRNSITVDAAGVPVPPEALTPDGQPDLPPAGRVPR